MEDHPAASSKRAARVLHVDDCRIPNGIFHHLRSGSRLIYLPERYGPRTTVFNSWRKSGVWQKLVDSIIAVHEARGSEVQMSDSTSVRVQQQAAAQKNRADISYRSRQGRNDDQATFAGEWTWLASVTRTLGRKGP